MRDAPIDGLIRKSLSAGVRRTPDHYVSENLMAAYLEASLSPQEMSAFEAHVSDCAICQEVLAVYMKLQPHEADGLPNEALPEKKTLFRFSLPIPVAWGAAGLCSNRCGVLPIPERVDGGCRERPGRRASGPDTTAGCAANGSPVEKLPQAGSISASTRS